MEAKHESSSGPAPRSGRSRHGFLSGLLIGAVAAGLVGLAVGVTLPAARAAGAAARMMGGGDGGGWRGPGHGGPGGPPPTPEEMRDHAEFFVSFALHRVGATTEQQDRAVKILDGALDEMKTLHEGHKANREQLAAILAAPTIDRAAVEKVRLDEMALADTLTHTIANAMLDTADVLSAEQRAQLIANLQRFRDER
jgi:periplasmic protein CpxP/Spy